MPDHDMIYDTVRSAEFEYKTLHNIYYYAARCFKNVLYNLSDPLSQDTLYYLRALKGMNVVDLS